MNSQDYQQIFHEIKNTITLINSSVQLLNSKCPKLQSEPYWNNIRHEITYLKNMVLEISQASAAGHLQKEALDLNLLLKEICKQMKDTYPDQQWNLNLYSHLPVINADHIKLKQAVLNLLKNSAETDSQNITIATHLNSSFVTICVSDCGGGIPADLEDKVFQMFTTTKDQGTGLDLAITKQIIEGHGGTLKLENHPGKGCTFTISLPVS